MAVAVIVLLPCGNGEDGVHVHAPLALAVVVHTGVPARYTVTELFGSALPLMTGVVVFVAPLVAGAVIVGALPLLTGVAGVIGLAALLAVFVSPSAGAVVALNTGCVPTVLGLGVAGTVNVLVLFGVIGLGLVQVATWPLVLHVQPLLVNVLGALTPLGNVTVVVSGPVASPGPLLVMLIGTLLVWPAARLGEGWPMVVVRSGK